MLHDIPFYENSIIELSILLFMNAFVVSSFLVLGTVIIFSIYSSTYVQEVLLDIILRNAIHLGIFNFKKIMSNFFPKWSYNCTLFTSNVKRLMSFQKHSYIRRFLKFCWWMIENGSSLCSLLTFSQLLVKLGDFSEVY